jgi:hypothetical protein
MKFPSLMPKLNPPSASNADALLHSAVCVWPGDPDHKEGRITRWWRPKPELAGDAAEGSLHWRSNRGDVHVRLSQVALEQGQKRTVAEGLLGYVLPAAPAAGRYPLAFVSQSG